MKKGVKQKMNDIKKLQNVCGKEILRENFMCGQAKIGMDLFKIF